MKRSQLFTKTLKDAPADEVSKNAQLLIRAGFVHKEMAGAYTFLPLGLRVLEKVNNIIRDEMNAVGGQELRLTALQDPEIWKASDRWDDGKVDIWFKTHLKNGSELGLGWTQEEPLVRAAKSHIHSYKDLPFTAYQIQTKFRNELRAKSGIMRGREFLMKDMYTFARNKEEHNRLYDEIKEAYNRVFSSLGIGEKTFITSASGGVFSKFSHEFQTICDAGEDIIYIDHAKKIAVNEEVYTDEVLADLGLDKSKLEKAKAAEVGNIFTLGDKFTKAGGMTYIDEDGAQKPILMGCYGIGPSRTVGVIAELLSDENGLVWPMNIAPYQVYLATIGDVSDEADQLYQELTEAGIEVLYDDRDVRPGEKFADAELMGIPIRIVMSQKTLDNNEVELKKRTDEKTTNCSIHEVIGKLKKDINQV